ncbi:hypothetical protein D3C75_1231710 [compost metagenome]
MAGEHLLHLLNQLAVLLAGLLFNRCHNVLNILPFEVAYGLLELTVQTIHFAQGT